MSHCFTRNTAKQEQSWCEPASAFTKALSLWDFLWLRSGLAHPFPSPASLYSGHHLHPCLRGIWVKGSVSLQVWSSYWACRRWKAPEAVSSMLHEDQSSPQSPTENCSKSIIRLILHINQIVIFLFYFIFFLSSAEIENFSLENLG